MVLASAWLPVSASGAASRPSDGDLSQRLAELAKPAVRSAPPARQAERLGVAKRGPGSLLREGNRVLVEVRFERGAAAGVEDLRAAGARIVHVSPRYQTVTVAARPDQLRRLSDVPRVAGATEVLAPIVYSAEEPGPVPSAITPCFGAATSEGDEQLRAAQARAEFEVDGSGVTVGILSDSFDQDAGAATDAEDDVASGDLPGPGNPCERESSVDVLDDTETEGSDEGRAMAQIVHDLAPGADLSFATAFNSLTAFAESVRELRDEGADVIVDDVSYFEEPFFQEGPVGVAASDVTETGVAYFSSAGNNNLIVGSKNVASWEAEAFRDSGSCPSAVLALEFGSDHCLDFNPSSGGVDRTFGITVKKGRTLTVDLQWAEPWSGVDADLDAFLVGLGGVLAASVDDNVEGSEKPFELLQWENTTGADRTVQVVVNRCAQECNPSASSTADPRVKLAILQNGSGVSAVEYPDSVGGDVVGPTIFGHNGAANAVSVGAVPFDDDATPEPYSSRGPVTHYFGPVDELGPAAELSEPLLLSKPDVAATDCGATTFFSFQDEEVWRFCGTSAAAPHAAAVSALMLQEEVAATPVEIRTALQESAVGVGSFGPCAVGAGLIDAVGAIEYLLSPELGANEPCEPPESMALEEEEDDSNDASSGDSAETATPPPVVPPPVAPDPPPHTFIKKRPGRVVFTPWKRGRAVFKFRSNEPGVLFLCQFDRKRWRRCGPRFVRWFRVGRHVLRVKARDAAGNIDPTPAIHRFRVRRVSKERFARIRAARRQARRDRR